MRAGLEVLLIDGLGKDPEDSLVFKHSESLGHTTTEIIQQGTPEFLSAANQCPKANLHRREGVPRVRPDPFQTIDDLPKKGL